MIAPLCGPDPASHPRHSPALRYGAVGGGRGTSCHLGLRRAFSLAYRSRLGGFHASAVSIAPQPHPGRVVLPAVSREGGRNAGTQRRQDAKQISLFLCVLAPSRLCVNGLEKRRDAKAQGRNAETTSSFAPLRLRAFALNDWMAVESMCTRSRLFILAYRQPHPVRIVLPTVLGGEPGRSQRLQPLVS